MYLIYAKSKYDLEHKIHDMISDEDHALLNGPEGIWFTDDEGRLVRATMDMSTSINNIELEQILIRRFSLNTPKEL